MKIFSKRNAIAYLTFAILFCSIALVSGAAPERYWFAGNSDLCRQMCLAFKRKIQHSLNHCELIFMDGNPNGVNNMRI